MVSFNCRILTPQGQIVNVKMTENDKIECVKKLKANGMTPISIEEDQISTFLNKNLSAKKPTATIHARRNVRRYFLDKNSIVKLTKNVSPEELKQFTQDLLLLLTSKFKLKDAIKTIIDSTENVYFKSVLKKMNAKYLEGEKFYKTMREYPEVFPRVYVNIVKHGELSNDMEHSLENAIKYLDNEVFVKEKIRRELYPSLYLFAGIILLVFLSIIIGVPVLNKAIELSGNVLAVPKIIKILNVIFTAILKTWYVWIMLFGVLVSLFIRYIETEDGKLKYDTFKYKNPLFGKTFFFIDFARIMRNTSYNLNNGLRIQDALEVSKHATKNLYMLNLIERALNNIYAGKPWITVFEEEGSFDSIIIEMLKKSVKTESKDLMEKTIKYTDSMIGKEIDRVVKRLPIISYSIVGIALLLFVLIILIPIIKVYLSGLLVL